MTTRCGEDNALSPVSHGTRLCHCVLPLPGHVTPATPSNVVMTIVRKNVTFETDKHREPQFIENINIIEMVPADAFDHMLASDKRAIDDAIADLFGAHMTDPWLQARSSSYWIRDDNREHRRGWLYCYDVEVHVYHRRSGPAGRPKRLKRAREL